MRISFLPLSHDEVVHGKGSFTEQDAGRLVAAVREFAAVFAYMFAHPGKKTAVHGGRVGQRTEWTQDRELEWDLLQ